MFGFVGPFLFPEANMQQPLSQQLLGKFNIAVNSFYNRKETRSGSFSRPRFTNPDVLSKIVTGVGVYANTAVSGAHHFLPSPPLPFLPYSHPLHDTISTRAALHSGRQE